jgi:hypothetical protein
MKKLGMLLAALIVSLAFASNQPAEAGVAAANGLLPSGVASTVGTGGLVHKTHGWHCKPRYGYVPSLGYSTLHRHRAACRKRGRCYRKRRACRYRYGHGRRFYRCLRRSGC